MNPFKRLKLKAMLRNCDYILAGTVIKQQYYDANKNTEINRLIDQFMANPGFEEALKLIGYNDFMVFYFTESCTDGLYVRKTSQEPQKASALPSEHSSSRMAPASASSTRHASSRSLNGLEHDQLENDHTKSYNLTLSKDKQEVAASVDIELMQINSSEEPKELSEKTRQLKQIIQESEEWMEQVIAKRQQKKPETLSTAKVKPTIVVNEQQQPLVEPTNKPTMTSAAYLPDSMAVHEGMEHASDAKPLLEKLQNAVLDESEYIEPQVMAVGKKKQEKPKETPAAEMKQHESTAAAKLKQVELEGTFAVAAELKQNASVDGLKLEQPAPVLINPQTHDDITESAVIPAKVAKIMRPDFPNVVATLKIDIHTMSKQLNDYRKQLSFSPSNEAQLKAWIRSLEEAIQEFSLALDLLEGED